MIFDKLNLFFDDTRICEADSSTISEVLDLGFLDAKAPRLPEFFHDSVIYAQVTEVFAGTSTNLTLRVEVASDLAFTAPIVVARSEPVPTADLVVGFNNFDIAKPKEFNERYIRIVASGTDTFGTSGRLTAGIVLAKMTNR